MQEEFASKTKRKQQMLERQALGSALLELPPGRLDALELPRELADALREGRRIASHEARRRHLQYIGRIMRDLDPEPIRAALADLEGRSALARARHRRIEQWRDRLLEDDGALTQFARQHRDADLQALRALIRNARREIAQDRSPRAQRALFRLLRDLCA